MKQKTLIEKLISNPVVQTLVIYISGSWIILEMTDYFIDHYDLVERARDILLIVLLCGLPIAVTIAWNINRKRSAAEKISADQQAVVGDSTAGKRRKFVGKPWFTIPAIVLVLLVGFAVIRSINHKTKVKWAKAELLPEAEKLGGQLKRIEAYHLLQKAAKYIPDDPDYKDLIEKLSTKISILSEPPGAMFYVKNYSNPDDEWELLGTTPIDSIEMPRLALYRYLMVKPGHDSVMACFSSSQDTLFVKLFLTGTIPEGMVHVPGLGNESISNHLAEKNDFFIDKYEVTNQQFKEFVDNQGYENPDFWEHAFEMDGKNLDRGAAIKLFVDKSGRPGPSTWEAGDYPDGHANFPVNGISWFEAAAYAEFAGKELPTVDHWTTVAGFYINDFWYLFSHKLLPMSNFKNVGPEPCGHNHGINPYGTYDLAGNVREWCWNKTQDGRLIRGGAWNDVSYMYTNWGQLSPLDRSTKNGFRCAVYPDRENIPEDAFEILELEEVRDYYSEPIVSDDIFSIYLKQFLYDELALNPVLEIRDDSEEDWIMEKFSFNAAYENERMIAYIFLPKSGKPPYQTMIFFPGSYAVYDVHFPDKWFFYFCDFLLKNGIAAVMPIYKSTYERAGSMPRSNHSSNESHLYTEYLIKWVKDFSRTIDYLETRADIDTSRIGLYTHSWGGVVGAIIPAVERRLKLCVHVTGGFSSRALPEADQINYLPRVKVPVLMLNGKYDFTFPLEADVKPYFDLLGTEEGDKVLKVYESDHWIPTTELIRETLDWCEKYFGPVTK